jgi:hypothetical protein
MPLFSAAFRAAASRRGFRPILQASFTWPAPTGAKAYTAEAGWGTDGVALDPRILEAASIDASAPLAPGGISFPEASILLADRDRKITRILEGATDPKGSPCTLTWAAEGLAIADWHTCLSGIFDRPETANGGNAWRLFLRAQDAALQGTAPKAQILKAETPLANTVNPPWGSYWPIVYGSHDAQALTGRGMVPAINWAFDAPSAQWRYAPCLAFAKSIPRVYKNGTLQTLGVHYALTHPIVGGKQITSIDLTSNPGADAVITCDIDGIEETGDGTGELILNPVRQLEHFLTNFGFGDWRFGAWGSTTSQPIDTDSLAVSKSHAGTFGFEGAMRLGGDTKTETISQIIERWLRSWLPYRGFWTEGAGRFGLRPIDHRFAGYTSPGPTVGTTTAALFFRGRVHELDESFWYGKDTGKLIRRINLEYCYGGQDQKFFQSLAVQDVSQPQDVSDPYSLDFSSARIV